MGSERKPLFLNDGVGLGFHEEMATDDTMTLGGLTMGGQIDMGDSKIVNLGMCADAYDAAPKEYVDEQIAAIPPYVPTNATSGSGGGTIGVLTTDSDTALNINGSTVLQLSLETDGGLEFSGVNKYLQIDNMTNGGLSSTGGEHVVLEASQPTLQINGSNELGVKYDTLKGLATSDNGLVVKVDNATIEFDVDGYLAVVPGYQAASEVEANYATTGTVNTGDPVYWDGYNNEVAAGDASSNAMSRIIGVAQVGGDPALICSLGIAEGVLAGATVGTPYYLQSGGGIGTGIPSGPARVVLVGYAKNATDLWVNIIDYGKKV